MNDLRSHSRLFKIAPTSSMYQCILSHYVLVWTDGASYVSACTCGVPFFLRKRVTGGSVKDPLPATGLEFPKGPVITVGSVKVQVGVPYLCASESTPPGPPGQGGRGGRHMMPCTPSLAKCSAPEQCYLQWGGEGDVVGIATQTSTNETSLEPRPCPWPQLCLPPPNEMVTNRQG